MSRVLVLFAHPNQTESKVNLGLFRLAHAIDGVTAVDLYAEYPRFKVDIDTEQDRLLEHDLIVLQFPFYWYSTPALLKEWQDLVLEFGFAYGEKGDKLKGKSLLVATTAGGAEEAYQEEGKNHFPIRTLLAPLEQTAGLCQMHYLAPLVLFASLTATDDDRAERHREAWQMLLHAAVDDRLDIERAEDADLMDVAALPIHEPA